MRSGFLGWLMAAVVLPGVAGASVGAPAATGVYELRLVPLGHEVFLLQRPDPFRQPVEPNALFIVNDADVVVVDSGGSALAAENAIRHIRSITKKPVSVVINTHWHGDHNLGNAVYRREFPGVRIAAHRNTQRDIAGKPMDYVKRYPKMLADYAAELEESLAAARAESPRDEAKVARREAALADIAVMAREIGRVEVSPPDWVFDSELTLLRGARTIQVMHLGKGNTEGDVVVWLPTERILASGDLVVAPIPYGFGSFPEQWLAKLDRLKAFDFEILVPGHGEVMRDRAHIETVQMMLRSVRAKAQLAVAHGTGLDAFKAALDFTPFARGLVGDDARRLALFKDWWSDPIARSAWLEARGEPIVQGASDETG
jgi:glyoxylase-like metal-dependent hydrolase (beta-lactamase superfamily II)